MNNTIKLDNGREVKLLFNLNALEIYCDATGLGLESLEMKKADIKTLKMVCWAAAKEGEASEGRELDLIPETFGRLVTPAILTEMVSIITPQLTGKKKAEEKGRSPRMFFRRTQGQL